MEKGFVYVIFMFAINYVYGMQSKHVRFAKIENINIDNTLRVDKLHVSNYLEKADSNEYYLD